MTLTKLGTIEIRITWTVETPTFYVSQTLLSLFIVAVICHLFVVSSLLIVGIQYLIYNISTILCLL